MSFGLWIILGIILCIAEIFHPAMILFPIGVSAIITGVFGLLIENIAHIPYNTMISIQILTFLITSALNIIILRKLYKEWVSVKAPKHSEPENAILGKEVYAKQDAPANTMIEVVSPSPILGINLWHAKVIEDVKANDKLIVVGHEGGVLLCKKAK